MNTVLNFWVPQNQGITLLAEQILTSQEGELVS
jgi:hypothetical protein